MKEYIVSWDIAKNNDATVIEFWWLNPQIIGDKNQRIFTYWVCDFIIKWEQMSYTEQVDRLALILGGERYKNNHVLLMDGTGVGQAIADLARSKGLTPIEVVFSGGIKEQPLYYGQADQRFGATMDIKLQRGWSVPKVEMITDARALIEQDRVKVPTDIPYSAEFKRELVHFQGKVNDKGHTTYGNDAEAKHDDFVASFLMFCWWVKFNEKSTLSLEKPVNRAAKTYEWSPFKSS